MCPRNDFTSITFVDGCISIITLTLFGSIFNPSLQTICPSNFPCETMNLHFFGFKVRHALQHLSMHSPHTARCLSSVLNTNQSSKNALKFPTNILSNMCNMILWNVVSALHRPNGIWLYAYTPSSTTNVVFSLSSSTMQI